MSMPRLRNYSAEYQRRLVKAAERGLSRSQARGHAREGERPILPATAKDSARFEAALKLYRHSRDQAASARALHIAPERLRRFLRENVQVEGRGRTLKITDYRIREMTVISKGKASTTRLRGFDQASLNGDHLNAVKAFLNTNDADLLAPFAGRSVTDDRGVSHPLETGPNTLRRLAHAGDEPFHEIYRLSL
ncbi:hypothetical protein EQZ23_15715 [Sphingomonas sp. UV9]|uniref:hypothetical protein n=1 Tax=Sphingomonas sp. UV9 TaxID=1851410 RepID=UPI000FFCC38C|nr:hypothetical protein [Sphingomonas sp. UV9]RXD03756.1 hypothetical protein EQZ23_15715 [Sphingomonas sp. UV9]